MRDYRDIRCLYPLKLIDGKSMDDGFYMFNRKRFEVHFQIAEDRTPLGMFLTQGKVLDWIQLKRSESSVIIFI